MNGNWIIWVKHRTVPVPHYRYVEVKSHTFSTLTLGGRAVRFTLWLVYQLGEY
jgi:hypothetical protein